MARPVNVSRFDVHGRHVENAEVQVDRLGDTTDATVFLSITHGKNKTLKQYAMTAKDFAELVKGVFPDASFTMGKMK